MPRALFAGAWVYLASALMLGLPASRLPEWVCPDLLLPVVVFFALGGAARPAAVFSFLTGLWADLVFGSTVGVFAVGYLAVGALTQKLGQGVIRRAWVLVGLWLLVAALVVHGAQGVVSLLGGSGIGAGEGAALVAQCALGTGAIGAGLLRLMVEAAAVLRLVSRREWAESLSPAENSAEAERYPLAGS